MAKWPSVTHITKTKATMHLKKQKWHPLCTSQGVQHPCTLLQHPWYAMIVDACAMRDEKTYKIENRIPKSMRSCTTNETRLKIIKRRNYIKDWNKITMLYSYTFLITNTCWYYYGDYSYTHTNSLNTNAFFYSALLSTTNYVLFFF